jgi:hypothetical protein
MTLWNVRTCIKAGSEGGKRLPVQGTRPTVNTFVTFINSSAIEHDDEYIQRRERPRRAIERIIDVDRIDNGRGRAGHACSGKKGQQEEAAGRAARGSCGTSSKKWKRWCRGGTP